MVNPSSSKSKSLSRSGTQTVNKSEIRREQNSDWIRHSKNELTACGCIGLYRANGLGLGAWMLRWSLLVIGGSLLWGTGCRSVDGKDKTFVALFEKAPREKAPGSQPFRVELPGSGGSVTVYVAGEIANQNHMSLLLKDARLVADPEGDYLMELILNERGLVHLQGLTGNTHLLLVATWHNEQAKPKAGWVRRMLGSVTVDENMKLGLMRFTPLTESRAEATERVKGIKRMLGHKVK